MRTSDLRVRLLAVIGATSLLAGGAAACGSDSSTSGTTLRDAADERAADAQGDGSGDENPRFNDDAAFEAAPFDAADERPPSVRRPFLVGSSLRSAPSVSRDDWTASRVDTRPVAALDAATARELARVWLADGLEEHASVAAFARFTMLLLSVGAPPDLVLDAQRASIDEIAHARDCFALARRYGATAAGPGGLDVHDAIGPMTLADLAALTTEEGCIGETLGAALATAQLDGAVDPEVRRILTRIVRDEARHAELAWRFVAWAITEERRGSLGAAGVTTAVEHAAEHAIRATRAMTIRQGTEDLAAWHAQKG